MSVRLKFIPLQFNWVAIHPQPKGVVYFIGGAGFGTFPTLFYRYLLRGLFQEGYTIIVIPFRFTLNHWSVAIDMVRDLKDLLHAIYEKARHLGYTDNLDLYTNPEKIRSGSYYWLGHSLGCKYIALLEVLSDSEQSNIEHSLNNCIKDKRQIKALKRALQGINLKEISLHNQPSILMAPIITGIEGAIPIKFIADLVKKFIDVRPTEKQTKCLIKLGKLFHFTALIGFKNDRVQARAQTIYWLEKILPNVPFPLIYIESAGGHLAPLNLCKDNEELVDCLVDLLPILKARVQSDLNT
ncbi:MAG: DUF1350 family protein [Cyanobacteria bacterium SBLK]|nr:DUF1350 family protein [Cyanobacteria bacterium SBLK]